MQLKIENDFQQKVMRMAFAEPTRIENKKDVLRWRQEWMNALKTWHSPYKALIDATNLEINKEESAGLRDEFERMKKFLEGLFLRKAVVFGLKHPEEGQALPFESAQTADEASVLLGIRKLEKVTSGVLEFRDAIVLENHFRQHVVEMSFSQTVEVLSAKEWNLLKSKLTNNLMQWHSKWSLIVDCTNLKISSEAHGEYASFLKYFRGFFLKAVVGYGIVEDASRYPFKVFRSRHKAAAELEGEGMVSGDDAECRSRKG